jgi:hypothetical protein
MWAIPFCALAPVLAGCGGKGAPPTGGSGRAAQIACSQLPGPVYLQIADSQEPLFKEVGKMLRNQPASAMTLIYVTSGSCENLYAIIRGTPITKNPKYIPSSLEMPSWTTGMDSPTCTIDADGHAIDVATLNVMTDACGKEVPGSLGVLPGPVQARVFAVPQASTQSAITAKEAYFVFGFGQSGRVVPWIDEQFMFIRTPTKGTLQSMASNLRVPAMRWKGRMLDGSADVLAGLGSSAAPEKSIGILGVEVADAARKTVKNLAYRHWDQTRAYYPDSSATSFDKQNVRDGHYPLWSPTMYVTSALNYGTTVSRNPRVAYLLDLVWGQKVTPPPPIDPIDIEIEKGLVPSCAMMVVREVEGGPIRPFVPRNECQCYYLSKVGGDLSGCKACTNDADCGGTLACTRGYCQRGTPRRQPPANPPGCVPVPEKSTDLLNACTNAQAIDKNTRLPLERPDGTLPPLQ